MKNDSETLRDAEQVIRAYIDERIKDVSILPGGHINSTFLVSARERYVLQCLKPELYADNLHALANNYNVYCRACFLYEKKEAGRWRCPEWMLTEEGGFFHKDAHGDIWRMYRYIPSDGPTAAKEADMYEVGKGVGKLHLIMRPCDGIMSTEDNSKLFDLTYHYRNYRKQNTSPMHRIEELDQFIENNIEKMQSIRVPAGQMIHGDVKFGNMIFDHDEVVGFVDLDTIMPGSIFDDLADCARSFCMKKDGSIDPDKFSKVISGYEEGAGTAFSEDAARIFGENVVRNRFMLGIRYYTDYLAQSDRFSDLDPMQKLERARELLISP